MTYLKNALTPATQREALSGQIANSAGGFSFQVEDWTRLERFLILGSEGGSYYATERKLTRDNAQCVERCIKTDGLRVVRTIVAISDAGRAPKNDPAILALALCAKTGDDVTRAAAYAALPKVCRIGTHLYHFVEFANAIGGWGRGMRTAIGAWFNNRAASDLAYQLIKYQQRDGWSSRDLLRLAHVKPASNDHSRLYKWATTGEFDALEAAESDKEDKTKSSQLDQLAAYEAIKKTDSLAEVVALVKGYNLPRECVPSKWLTTPEVWEALLPKMKLTAMIRNLANMTRAGVIAPMSAGTAHVRDTLANGEYLRKSRVHPIQVLSALMTYKQGHGARGGNTWTPVGQIVDALDAAFYASFGNVEATGKNMLLALDVSGSMHGGEIAGVPGLTPAIGAAAMAMVTAAVEPNFSVVGFTSATSGRGGYGGKWDSGTAGITPIDVSAKRRLDDVVNMIAALPMGGTDCALPMIWAAANKVPVDTFCVYTDNETWAGRVHPTQALKDYRKVMNRPNAKSVVIGMLANEFTIADPKDPGMIDIIGFDTATPSVISTFSRGAE